MTDQQLRDELHRIAESAPEAYVPADTFARGRRAHRRSVVIAIGAISAAIAVIAGSLALAPTRDSAEIDPARGDVGLAVPDTLYGVPTWLAESEDGRYTHADDLEQDLSIGVGAIAYVQSAEDSNTAVPVVVDADDGDYHPLDLPDFIGLDPYWENGYDEDNGHHPVALSPDGRHLAWAWGRGRSAPEEGPVPSGVRVADLTTGNITQWGLGTLSCPTTTCEDRGVYVTDLEWSDGGKKLLWGGSRMDRWDDESYVPGDAVAGVLDPGTTTITPYAGTIDGAVYLSTWAVADDGTIAYSGSYDSSAVRLQPPGGEATEVALPANASTGTAIQFRGTELYIATDEAIAPLEGSGTTYPLTDSMPPQTLGWVGEAPLVRAFGDTGGIHISRLGESEKDARVLIDYAETGSGIAGTTSVAYALIDPDAADPTVFRIPPIFVPPWLKTTAFCLVIVLIAVALWRWRRRPRTAQRPRRATSPDAVVMFVLLAGLVLGLLYQSRASFTLDLSPERPGGVVTIPSAATADAPDPSRAVIPRDIRWTDNPDEHVPISDSLAVGRATLAFPDETFVNDGGAAVVLTVDGSYHRLHLPDVREAWGMMEEPLRLSADGTRLAYTAADKSLNVIDLETGKVTEHPLEMDGRVTSFSWSPNGEWLVWDSNYEHRAAGRIAPDGTTEPLPKGRWENAGIGDDGTVVVRDDSGTRIWPGGPSDLPGTDQAGLSTWVGTGTTVDGVDHPDVRSIGWDAGRNLDLAIGHNPSVRGVDIDGRGLVGVAGWLADGTTLIVTEDGDDDGQDLRTVSPDGETKIVAQLDHRVTRLTIATALPADIAVTAPDPDWTSRLSTDDLPTVILAAAVLGLAVLVAWLWVWSARRRRRRAEQPDEDRGY